MLILKKRISMLVRIRVELMSEFRTKLNASAVALRSEISSLDIKNEVENC